MTQESIQPILDWISAHPTWSGFVVFLISLSESLAIVGLIVPGVVMMTAIGGMMGAGILPFWLTLAWAILGAIAGDGISYWLGYHYHEHLRDFWPFKQFPKLLIRGEAFFRQHGGKSIVFGRFVGPVRPMIPVIAGMLDMSPKRFLFFNVLSAIAWAPLYSLPGILIGASLESLSPAVATRAGLLVLFLLFVLWLFYEVLLLLGAWIISMIQKALNRVWKVLNRLPWLDTVLRTAQGTEESQLGFLLLFIFAFLVSIITIVNALNVDGLALFNEPVYQVLRALYSDKFIAILGFITAFGSPWVLMPAVVGIALWLCWQKRSQIGLCWLLTIIGGFLIGHLLKIETAIPRPEGLLYFSEEYAFPSGHTLLATLTFGFAAILIQHAIASKYRWIPWLIALPFIFLIALSRLYLGVHWFTDIVGGIFIGILFVSLGAFFYRRIDPKSIPISAILTPGLLLIAISLSIYSYSSYPLLRKEIVRQWSSYVLVENTWWEGKDPSNALYRRGAFRRHGIVFDLQYLGALKTIETSLEKAGWKTIPKLDFQTGILFLDNNPSPMIFPIMPKFHRDRLPVLTLAKPIDQTKRLVIQFWQSDYATAKGIPLWVGTLRLEEASHPLPLVTLYLEEPYTGDIFQQLLDDLKNYHNIRNKIITTSSNDEESKVLLLTSP